MDDNTLARQSYTLIQKDFGLEETFDFEKSENSFEQLLAFLTRVVQHLIDHDFSRLLNALYRIDVPESKVKQILELTKPGQIASRLAEEIIRREKEKVLTRAKYSS